MTEEQITKLKKEMLDIIHRMSDEELQEDLDNYMIEKGLCAKAKNNKQGWTSKEGE